MTTDNFLSTVRDLAERVGEGSLIAAGFLMVAILIGLAELARRVGRGDAAKKVTTFATVLGLGWSAQGMADAAINTYNQPWPVAAVLFLVFEAWLVGRMLRAHQYRTDYARRRKFVTAVWLGAVVMAVVVATGEGWSQAPGRLAIPLLVAYGWYTDLTAADDPAEKPVTSWRWTPRRLLLAVGALEPGTRDAVTIDRDRLRDRMTRLAFRIDHGSPKVSGWLHRKTRLAKMKTVADDDDLNEVRARLARMSVNLMAPPPKPISRDVLPSADIERPPPRRSRQAVATDTWPQGVHMRHGKVLRGEELFADGVRLVLDSVSPDLPRGYSNATLAEQYDPPLKERTAEKIGAAARKRLNGSVPAHD